MDAWSHWCPKFRIRRLAKMLMALTFSFFNKLVCCICRCHLSLKLTSLARWKTKLFKGRVLDERQIVKIRQECDMFISQRKNIMEKSTSYPRRVNSRLGKNVEVTKKILTAMSSHLRNLRVSQHLYSILSQPHFPKLGIAHLSWCWWWWYWCCFTRNLWQNVGHRLLLKVFKSQLLRG